MAISDVARGEGYILYVRDIPREFMSHNNYVSGLSRLKPLKT